MPSTFFGLNIGTSGLYTYQAALNTTAHNISNTDTEGYTRQMVTQQAGTAIRVNATHGMVGSGVVVTGITQARDAYYDMKYRNNNTTYGEYSAKQYYMTEIENYFNEVTVDGFTTSYNKLFDSMQSLSTDPSNLTNRTEVTNYAENLTDYFNNLSNSLKSIQEEANFEVKNQVDRINSLAEQIASVTKQINTSEAGGGIANDLRDQRELLIDSLSNIANVSVTENVVGDNVGVTSYIVKIEGQTLVNTNQFNALEVVPRTEKANLNDADGLYEIKWADTGNDFAFQNTSSSGYLKAVLDVRDGNNNEVLSGTIVDSTVGDNEVSLINPSISDVAKLNIPAEGYITINNKDYKYDSFTYDEASKTYTFTLEDTVADDLNGKSASIGDRIDYKGIPYYMGQLNELVRTFAKEFNDLHKTGYDLNGEQGIDFFNGREAATGNNYDFDTDSYYLLTAANFTVTDAISDDPSKIALSSSTTEGVENKDILDALLDLKGKASMFKQGTPASFFQTFVAEIGIDSTKAKDNADSQEDILDMITNQRLSVSGVDIDDEAMNLVMFQNAYNLSAKVISVMNEVYDKLINGTGV